MKTPTLSELKRDASDRFSYILVFCPKFPPATGTNTTKAFEKLINLIDAIMERTNGDDAKQWLRICLHEVQLSWKHYEGGNLTKGRQTIQRAEDHFNNAFSKKPIEPRFVAGGTGAAFDSEKGFPE